MNRGSHVISAQRVSAPNDSGSSATSGGTRPSAMRLSSSVATPSPGCHISPSRRTRRGSSAPGSVPPVPPGGAYRHTRRSLPSSALRTVWTETVPRGTPGRSRHISPCGASDSATQDTGVSPQRLAMARWLYGSGRCRVRSHGQYAAASAGPSPSSTHSVYVACQSRRIRTDQCHTSVPGTCSMRFPDGSPGSASLLGDTRTARVAGEPRHRNVTSAWSAAPYGSGPVSGVPSRSTARQNSAPDNAAARRTTRSSVTRGTGEGRGTRGGCRGVSEGGAVTVIGRSPCRRVRSPLPYVPYAAPSRSRASAPGLCRAPGPAVPRVLPPL